MTSIFVYGTLKRGYYNHESFMGRANYFGPVCTAPDYVLYQTPPNRFETNFPLMVHRPGNGLPVKGELYQVSDYDLRQLDNLEGHPHFYVRSPIELEGGLGEVQAYLINLLTRSLDNYIYIGDVWPCVKKPLPAGR